MSLHLGETSKIFSKTLPFVLVRTTIYLGFGLLTLIYLGLLFGFMAFARWAGGDVGGTVGFIVFLVGLGGGFAAIRFARAWLLYNVKAAHVAVATAYVTGGSLPEGESQWSIGKDLVTKQFVDVNLLFVLDGLIKGAIRAVNRLIKNITDMIPIPGMESLADWAQRVVNMALTYLDETVLSYSLAKGDKNVWNSGMEGVVLYAQSYKTVLKDAVYLALGAWVATIVLFIMLIIPFWLAAGQLSSGTLRTLLFIAPLVLGYTLKLSVVNSFAMISVLISFHRNAAGQPISQEWKGRLESASEKFRELQQKAEAFARDKGLPGTGKKAATTKAAASSSTSDPTDAAE